MRPRSSMALCYEGYMGQSSFAMTPGNVASIERTLTVTRLSSYAPPMIRPRNSESNSAAAIRLYQWNAEIAGALWPVMHVFEVAVRNAISEVITEVHGPTWTHESSFHNKLPNPNGRNIYNPRRDIIHQSRKHQHAGKVIPELKMIFWERMLTSRHDNDFWGLHLRTGFPNAPAVAFQATRGQLREKFESVRRIRNRLGHHESVSDPQRFSLNEVFENMMTVLAWRDEAIADWVYSFETVQQTLQKRP